MEGRCLRSLRKRCRTKATWPPCSATKISSKRFPGLCVALLPAFVDVPLEEPVIGCPVRLLVAGLADVLLECVHLGVEVVHIVDDQGLQRLGTLGRAVFEDA